MAVPLAASAVSGLRRVGAVGRVLGVMVMREGSGTLVGAAATWPSAAAAAVVVAVVAVIIGGIVRVLRSLLLPCPPVVGRVGTLCVCGEGGIKESEGVVRCSRTVQVKGLVKWYTRGAVGHGGRLSNQLQHDLAFDGVGWGGMGRQLLIRQLSSISISKSMTRARKKRRKVRNERANERTNGQRKNGKGSS